MAVGAFLDLVLFPVLQKSNVCMNNFGCEAGWRTVTKLEAMYSVAWREVTHSIQNPKTNPPYLGNDPGNTVEQQHLHNTIIFKHEGNRQTCLNL